VRGHIRVTTRLFDEAKATLPNLSATARDIILDYLENGAVVDPRESRAGTDLQVIIDEDQYRAAQARARSEGLGLREIVELGLTRRLEALHDSDAGDP
jgi:hypothetical protein